MKLNVKSQYPHTSLLWTIWKCWQIMAPTSKINQRNILKIPTPKTQNFEERKSIFLWLEFLLVSLEIWGLLGGGCYAIEVENSLKFTTFALDVVVKWNSASLCLFSTISVFTGLYGGKFLWCLLGNYEDFLRTNLSSFLQHWLSSANRFSWHFTTRYERKALLHFYLHKGKWRKPKWDFFFAMNL